MYDPRNRGLQFALPVTRHAAEAEIAAHDGADRGNGDGSSPSPRTKRRMDAALIVAREIGRSPKCSTRKSSDWSATLPTGAVRQSPDVAHVGIEARQFLFDGGVAGGMAQHHAAGFVSTAEQNQAIGRCKSRPLGAASWERREGVARPEFPACGVGDFCEGFSRPFGRGSGRDDSCRRSSRGWLVVLPALRELRPHTCST